MPIFFILIVGTTLAIQIMMRKNKVDFKKDIEDIAERERKANLSRKKEIDKALYITPNPSVLPIKTYDESKENKKIKKAQEIAVRKAHLTMIRFDEPISNTDLKLKYGLANLEIITMYEEHYNSYMQALTLWAELLIEKNNLIDAEKVLCEAINLKSDLSKTYMLLIDVYKKTNNSKKLQNIIKLVEKSNLKLKSKILNYHNVNSMKNNSET